MKEAIAYVFVRGNAKGERIGLVKFGESGYYVTDEAKYCDSDADVLVVVAALNERLEVPADVAESLFAGSMFGWGVPAAARARLYAEGLANGS